MRNRSWRWLDLRIRGLLAADTRTARMLAPPAKEPDLSSLLRRRR